METFLKEPIYLQLTDNQLQARLLRYMVEVNPA
jgi:hypothetical protein